MPPSVVGPFSLETAPNADNTKQGIASIVTARLSSSAARPQLGSPDERGQKRGYDLKELHPQASQNIEGRPCVSSAGAQQANTSERVRKHGVTLRALTGGTLALRSTRGRCC